MAIRELIAVSLAELLADAHLDDGLDLVGRPRVELDTVDVRELPVCGHAHVTEAAAVACVIPNAEWVHGRGTVALVAWCSVPTVTLWPSPADALPALRLINNSGCGGRCVGEHELLDLASHRGPR